MKTLKNPFAGLLTDWSARGIAEKVISLALTALFYALTARFDNGHGVTMAANTYLTISMITKESLRILENSLAFSRCVNRKYDDKFGVEGAKIGTVLNVRKPPKYVGRTGAAVSIEDATETQVPVTLSTQFGVDIEFPTADLKLSINNFSDLYLKPAVARIANKIDQDGMALYNQIYQQVGTPGTTPNALLTYLLAGVALDNSAAPQDEQRYMVINPLMQAYIVDGLKGLFNATDAIAKQYRRGRMGSAAGWDWYMDQNVASHTVGPLGGTPLVNGAAQVGASLITDGWTAAAASRLKKGDIFTIANVFSVNPQSYLSTGQLQQFVVTADVSSDGAGNATIPISPSITVGTSQATVNASPADNAALTIVGAANTVTPQGMGFHRDAFVLASADLPVPRGVDMAGRESDEEVGLSIRFVRQYEVRTDKLVSRLDVLYGWSVLRPELAVRIAA